MPGAIEMRLEHFRAKWLPVRVKKMRQNKNLELGSDSIRTEKALRLPPATPPLPDLSTSTHKTNPALRRVLSVAEMRRCRLAVAHFPHNPARAMRGTHQTLTHHAARTEVARIGPYAITVVSVTRAIVAAVATADAHVHVGA